MKIKKDQRSRLYIQNLSSKTRKIDILNIFENYGKIINIHIPKDSSSGTSRGFAFVEYENPENASLAHQKLHKTKIDGRTISILFAEPKESPNLYSPYPVSPDRYNSITDNEFDESVLLWSKTKVAQYLYQKTSSSLVKESFLNNEISGDVLFTLTSQDLKDMGIDKVGIRKKLKLLFKIYLKNKQVLNFHKIHHKFHKIHHKKKKKKFPLILQMRKKKKMNKIFYLEKNL